MTTAPRTHSGYYVTARHAQSTAYLLGPFRTPGAALRMVAAGKVAALATDDPRFAFAAYGTVRVTMPVDQPLPVGRLDLDAAVQVDGYVGLVICGGYRK